MGQPIHRNTGSVRSSCTQRLSSTSGTYCSPAKPMTIDAYRTGRVSSAPSPTRIVRSRTSALRSAASASSVSALPGSVRSRAGRPVASATARVSASAVTSSGSKVTATRSIPTLTCADSTPGTARSSVSARVTSVGRLRRAPGSAYCACSRAGPESRRGPTPTARAVSRSSGAAPGTAWPPSGASAMSVPCSMFMPQAQEYSPGSVMSRSRTVVPNAASEALLRRSGNTTRAEQSLFSCRSKRSRTGLPASIRTRLGE